jgi:hypothetical protein
MHMAKPAPYKPQKTSKVKTAAFASDRSWFSWKSLVIVVVVFGLIGSYFLYRSFAYYPCQWDQIGSTATNSYHNNNLYVHFYRWDGSGCGRQFKIHVDFYHAPYQPAGYIDAHFNENDNGNTQSFGSTGSTGGWVNVTAYTNKPPSYNCDYGTGDAKLNGYPTITAKTSPQGCY